jgi:hypothetical protein
MNVAEEGATRIIATADRAIRTEKGDRVFFGRDLPSPLDCI